MMSNSGCKHLKLIQEHVKPSADGCEDCLKIGDIWVHLRLCLICGHVGCCDSSKNKHATKHFHSTKHPIIQSFEPNEDWRWCYVDNTFLWNKFRIVDRILRWLLQYHMPRAKSPIMRQKLLIIYTSIYPSWILIFIVKHSNI